MTITRKFINRETELRQLNQWYAESTFTFIPIYGRRRVGKTRLVQEFIKDKPAIFYLSDALAEGLQLKTLGQVIGTAFSDNILRENGFRDWNQLFEYLGDKITGRTVLAIDEFPYLVNANRAISSIFQKGIDEHLQKVPVFLILLGSSVGMMEREVLLHKAPLYGRRTGSLEIQEMPFSALAEFFPDKSFDELVQIYAVCGSVPAYLEKLDPSLDVFQNVESNVLRKNTYLYEEVEFLVREEFREPRNYFAILKAMSEGKRRLGEIMGSTGFEKSMVARYMDILRSLSIVEKEVPVTERNPEKSKLGLYTIRDHFFSFWFRYVFPNRSRLEIEQIEPVIQQIRKSFSSYVGFAFERLCRESCQKLMKTGVMEYTAIGKWWDKQNEIDVVALNENTETIYFGEAKWNAGPVGISVLEDLKRKAAKVKWASANRTERFMIFSKSGFSEKLQQATADKEDVLLVDMRTL
ncbi:MAG: ATP-binding protein [Pseudomonadota bacterium]